MSKLSLSRAWEESRLVLARDGRLFASLALALVVLPQTIVGLMLPRSAGEAAALFLISMAIIVLIGSAAQIALNRLAIGPSSTVGEAIKRGFVRLPALIGALLILMIGLFVVLIPVVLVLRAMGIIVLPSPANEAPGSVRALILLFVVLSYAIFQLTIPISAVESGGSLRLMTRSWQLARGAYLRLLAFVVVLFIGLVVVLLAGQLAAGSIIVVALGPPDVLSLSALVISLLLALIQAVFTVIFAVMLARIYAQLANRTDTAQPSVPKSGI